MEFLEQLKQRDELMYYYGWLNLICAGIFIILAYSTKNHVLGVNAWFKPFKFAFSTFLYAWAMNWYMGYLPHFNLALFNWTIITTLGFEVFYIALQAARGQQSHFNLSTPLYAALFQIMGVFATIATLCTAWVGILFAITDFPDLPVYYVWSMRFGILFFVIFAFEGAVMGARLSHAVGSSDDESALPIVNWSTKHGDLRIAHFIGMHALQVLPLLAFYILKNTVAVFFVSILYGALASYTLNQALKGKPMLTKKVS